MKNLIISVLLVLAIFDVRADLVDHLRPCNGKSDVHQMRNIDFIYMINLDHRPEKFTQSAGELGQYGIYPYRFSAINGWELSVETLNDVGLRYTSEMTPLFATTFRAELGGREHNEFMTERGRTYFTQGVTRGTIGCSLSHFSILKDAWESGYETIWVLEDDVTTAVPAEHFIRAY